MSSASYPKLKVYSYICKESLLSFSESKAETLKLLLLLSLYLVHSLLGHRIIAESTNRERGSGKHGDLASFVSKDKRVVQQTVA